MLTWSGEATRITNGIQKSGFKGLGSSHCCSAFDSRINFKYLSRLLLALDVFPTTRQLPAYQLLLPFIPPLDQESAGPKAQPNALLQPNLAYGLGTAGIGVQIYQKDQPHLRAARDEL